MTFTNVYQDEQRAGSYAKLDQELKRVLKKNGKLINLVSSPQIYIHEWALFSTRDFPENRQAKSGDKVKIIMTDVEDQRPVEDILWSHGSYMDVFQRTGLRVDGTYRPLGKENESFPWVNETRIAPWVIYVLAPQ